LSSAIWSDPKDAIENPAELVLDFEDVTRSPIRKLPTLYGGLTFENLVVVHQEVYRGEGYVNNTMSGKYVGYPSSGYPVEVRGDAPFDFYGAYLGVAWPVAEGEILTVTAFRGGRAVFEDRIRLSHLGPVWFGAGYPGVDMVRFQTQHLWPFVVDDIGVGLQRH
jgi:hypothetical protein